MSDYRHMSAALDFLNLQGDMLVMQVVERQCSAPGAPLSTNPKARLRCVEDNRFHLHYLAASIQSGNPQMFSDYCGWVKVVLGKRGIAAFHLKENLEHWKAALLASAPEPAPVERNIESISRGHAAAPATASVPNRTSAQSRTPMRNARAKLRGRSGS